ncbi:hypothetical protein [Cellulomonas sp. KRMCY2]|uniref:hypothetical protein n=1 Tax=Cellulomonas sp. KRMCY2 TaxID=1304865 RepID=UPI00045EA781|nr:hypothetical protein [Cellulomonas sp. KRMCY2]
MLHAAALVPETALLVPGAAGAAEVLAAERSAALGAVGDLVSGGPDRVVVVAAGRPGRGLVEHEGPVRASLGAAGLDDDALGWSTGPDRQSRPVVRDVATSVALLLLAEVGWAGAVSALVVPAQDAAALRAVGRDRTAGADRVALLLVGSLSARRGPAGPLAQDGRAAPFDDRVLADLADLGPDAVERLAAVPGSVAVELAVSAWAPWQVLIGATAAQTLGGPAIRGDVRLVSSPFDATYAVVVWDHPAGGRHGDLTDESPPEQA